MESKLFYSTNFPTLTRSVMIFFGYENHSGGGILRTSHRWGSSFGGLEGEVGRTEIEIGEIGVQRVKRCWCSLEWSRGEKFGDVEVEDIKNTTRDVDKSVKRVTVIIFSLVLVLFPFLLLIQLQVQVLHRQLNSDYLRLA